jgi:hypothetical protein
MTTTTYAAKLQQRVRDAHERRYDCKTWGPSEGWEVDGLGNPMYLKGIGCKKHHIYMDDADAR